jgi:hypothetical protein
MYKLSRCSALALGLLISLTGFSQQGPKWSVNGNGISNGEFLGTTNNEDLILKVNGNEGIRLKTNGDIQLQTGLVKIDPKTTGDADIKFQNDNSQNGGFIIGINSGNQNGNNAVLNLKENKNMLFKTNATEHMRITSTGEIGIGTTVPTATLDLAGTFRLADGTQQVGHVLTSDANGNASWSALPLTPMSPWTFNAPNVSFTGGNVGIGTTAPSRALHVRGNTGAPLYVSGVNAGTNITNVCGPFIYNRNGAVGNWSGIAFGDQDNDNGMAAIGVQFTDVNNNYGDLAFGTRGTGGFLEHMRITDDGNIGIGTATPGAKLDVTGTFRLNDGSQQNGYYLSTDVNGNASWQALPTPTSLWSQDQYGISNSGHVGVGTVANQYTTFHSTGFNLIDGSGASLLLGRTTGALLGEFGIEYSEAGGGLNFWKPFTNTTWPGTHNYLMFIKDNGNVGINTSTPGEKLSVNGTIESTNGGIKFPDGTIQTTAAGVGDALGTVNNPHSELYATDFIKVGTNSLYLGSNTSTPGTAEYIYTTSYPLVINGSNATNSGNVQNTFINPNDGRVAIGNISPKGKLHVNLETNYNTDHEAGVLLSYPTTASTGYNVFEVRKQDAFPSTGYTNPFVITDDGKIGMNVGSPVTDVHMKGFALIEGPASSLLLGGVTGAPLGEWGIEYNDQGTTAGLNFWKPFGNTTWPGTHNNIMFISDAGNVSINTDDSEGYRFAVNGDMIAEEIVVKLHQDWPDFVFSKEYGLMDLEDVESYITENSHLPNVPSAKEVENGVNLGEMDATLLQKIEELTLYMIDLQKQVNELKKENEMLQSKN